MKKTAKQKTKPSPKPNPSAAKAKPSGTKLIIVESPAKTRTIKKVLGRGYDVRSSMGHVRDLPKTKLGIDVERDFQPKYVPVKGKEKVIKDLQEAAARADQIYLASDPDREGEAIAWHVMETLDLPRSRFLRILFNEITKKGIQDGIANPRALDMNLVNSQQARRILDRLVGYEVSPILWKTMAKGLSAGRVQSVALRLICEREDERDAFVPQEYWSLEAQLKGRAQIPFRAELSRIDGEKTEVSDADSANRIASELRAASFSVAAIERKEKRRNPGPPFITSTLQQAASVRLSFSPKRTMMLAQQLYEGVSVGPEGSTGLITYMRTDSTRVADEAIAAARAYVSAQIGADFLPDQPRQFASKKGAQDAHEAIRPTEVRRTPEQMAAFLDRDQLRLYTVIWQRFMASQMAAAIFDTVGADIQAGRYTLRATGSTLKFAGFLKLYPPRPGEEEEDKTLPPLEQDEPLELLDLVTEQHFTQPPPRFTEASLIKELEADGIGRPSTYADTLSKIQARRYVVLEERRLAPTSLGRAVKKLLVETFPQLFEVPFTARMEATLDQIEEGELEWIDELAKFYKQFKPQVNEVLRDAKKLKESMQEQSDIDCPKCGAKLVAKWGRNGRFLACPNYPECKHTQELEGPAAGADLAAVQDETCPNCGSPMAVRSGRFGPFLACTAYPKCKTTKRLHLDNGTAKLIPDVPLEEKCPTCDSHLVRRHGRFGEFTCCSRYPDCKYVKRNYIGVACPREGCGGQLLERKSRRGRVFFSCDNYPKCKFATWSKPVDKACPECGASYLVEKSFKRDGLVWVCEQKDCKHKEPAPAVAATA
ncbi:MAG TPA: type I DNA topoisomerase [Acidobacteriota bacterium]